MADADDEQETPGWLRSIRAACGISGAIFACGALASPFFICSGINSHDAVWNVGACAVFALCLIGLPVAGIGVCVTRLVELKEAEQRPPRAPPSQGGEKNFL
ncbi:MAG: hypothetical protein HYS13_16255 [Planctomycetia bacterium]|nr:hypothetical protein [Planctomycetia bacterium]